MLGILEDLIQNLYLKPKTHEQNYRRVLNENTLNISLQAKESDGSVFFTVFSHFCCV
jgi:hypothetical protein